MLNGLQAKRLVKSSIIAVETTEQEVDDEDFIQDSTEVTDFVNAHRGSEIPSAATEPHGNRLLASDSIAPLPRLYRTWTCVPVKCKLSAMLG